MSYVTGAAFGGFDMGLLPAGFAMEMEQQDVEARQARAATHKNQGEDQSL